MIAVRLMLYPRLTDALMAFLLILNTVGSSVLGDIPSLMVVTAVSGVVMIVGLVVSAMRLPQVEPRAEAKVSLASVSLSGPQKSPQSYRQPLDTPIHAQQAFFKSWSDILTCVWQTAATCPNIAIMYAALALTEAGANSCTTLAAIYLADQIGLSSGNISLALL